MKTILQVLKKSTMYIIFIILLLIIQAFLDLELPSYTSNIINVGISNSGIKEIVPTVISEEEYKNILLFIKKEDKELINNSYKHITKENITKKEYIDYKNKYPYIDTDNLYLLKKDVDNNKIDIILNKAITLYTLTTNNEIKTQFNLNKIIPTTEGDFLVYLKNLNEEELSIVINKLNKNTEEILEVVGKNISVNYLKKEYEKIGINIGEIQTSYIIKTGLTMLLIALAIMICACLVSLLGSLISAKMGRDLRNKIFNKVINFSQVEIKKYGVSSLITRSTNDITQIQNMSVMIFRTLIFAPIIAIGAIIKVMNTNVSMTYIIALSVITVLICVITLFIVCMPKFEKFQKLIDKLNLTMREIISGIPVIRAFTNEKHEEKRFDNVNNNLMKTSLFLDRTMGLMFPIMMLVMNLTTLLIVYNGAKSIDTGLMNIGQMMAFIQYAMQIIMSFLMLSMLSIMLPRASVSIKRINEVIKEKNSITNTKEITKVRKGKKGEIQFSNVYFKYPDADEYVLKNITFTAEAGKTTAFIGSTGSGKSTLINLIPRLYEATKGKILVGGVPIKELKETYLHDIIGYVPQKGILFSGTIESNIKYGNNNITDEQMILASDIAMASTFINEKKNKYNYKIAQGGTNVSGGQKQRISIARAIAKDPDIYIFDDSFSALDFQTDAKVRENLKKYTKNKTTLIVGSRINTIMHADKIIVLNEGEIVGMGTHEELLKDCKIYKEIVSSQLERGKL